MRKILVLSLATTILALVPIVASAASGTATGAVGGAVAGAIVAGPVGAVVGVVVGSHVGWCEAHYRSYKLATDSYTGYDGQAHRCISPY
jgi:hypothetical protein